ncbi:hypothetical protein SETIT_4G230700v2 [Setaria italica]|nr:hypothetical protein SETIT_4G230700v2 [Setaria italica]
MALVLLRKFNNGGALRTFKMALVNSCSTTPTVPMATSARDPPAVTTGKPPAAQDTDAPAAHGCDAPAAPAVKPPVAKTQGQGRSHAPKVSSVDHERKPLHDPRLPLRDV